MYHKLFKLKNDNLSVSFLSSLLKYCLLDVSKIYFIQLKMFRKFSTSFR